MTTRAPLDPSAWAAYQEETAPALRQRLGAFAAVFAAFMGLGTLVEASAFPDRALQSILYYVLEAGVAAAGVVAIRRPPFRRWPRLVGAWTIATIMLLIVVYHSLVHAPAERVAMVLAAVLSVLAVLFPWGWLAQTLAALPGVWVFGVALACGAFRTADSLAIPPLTLVASVAASVLASRYLDRYRFAAFHREALQTQEAEIAATLLRVNQTLSAYVEHADMLERVVALAADAIGCDWCAIVLPDDDGGFRLAASAGLEPGVRTELALLTFTPATIPMFAVFRPGHVVEIADRDAQSLIPVSLLERFAMRSGLYAPIHRGTALGGVFGLGYRTRSGPFTDRERRLTLGIAQAIAVALDNDRLIAELQAASRLKSEFVATMSHELRTPLNVIGGYAEMLADGVFAPGTQPWDDAVTRIRRATEELTDLVSATLDLNRLDTGRDPVDRTVVDLGALLARVEREVEPLVQPGVALRWHAALEHGRIFTDAVKLRTVLKNLVVNALKFTTTGGVDVSFAADEGALVVTVRDTGIGIAPEHQAVIFEMFRQVDGSATRRFGGVGLGLHIVQRLVKLLGGTIAVASTPGVGSTFTVRLPDAVRVPSAVA